MHQIEEAEKRDHRKLGRQLDLFHLQDEAPGMVFWHPKGWVIWQEVEQYMRRLLAANGYQEVRCPQILDRSLWEKSGHWDNYRDAMFVAKPGKEGQYYAIAEAEALQAFLARQSAAATGQLALKISA